MKVPSVLLALALQACPHQKQPTAPPPPLPTMEDFHRQAEFLQLRVTELLDCMDALPENRDRSRFKPGAFSRTYQPYFLTTFIGANHITEVRYTFHNAMEDTWQPEPSLEDVSRVNIRQWPRTDRVNDALHELYPTIIPDWIHVADPDERDVEATRRQKEMKRALDDELHLTTNVSHAFSPVDGTIYSNYRVYPYLQSGSEPIRVPLAVFKEVQATAQALPLGECRSALKGKEVPTAKERQMDRLDRARVRLPEVHAALLEQLKQKGENVWRNYFIEGDDEVYYSEGFKLRVPGSGILTSWYDEQGELMEWSFHSFIFNKKVDIHSTDEGLWALEIALEILTSR